MLPPWIASFYARAKVAGQPRNTVNIKIDGAQLQTRYCQQQRWGKAADRVQSTAKIMGTAADQVQSTAKMGHSCRPDTVNIKIDGAHLQTRYSQQQR